MRLISPVDRWGQARDGKEKGKGGKLLSTVELQTGKNGTGSEWAKKTKSNIQVYGWRVTSAAMFRATNKGK